MMSDDKSEISVGQGDRVIHVLLPVCDDLFGRAVVDFASRYRWNGSPVFHLLFVIDTAGLLSISSTLLLDIQEDERIFGENLLTDLSLELAASVPTSQIVKHIARGSAHTEILKTADSIGADMIVLGSHGRTGLQKLLLGSVSSSVVAHAKCSAVIVRLPHAEEPMELPGPAAISIADLPVQMSTYNQIDEAV